MKIAFIFDSFEVGGIERVGTDYVKMLNNKGHEITVYNLHPDECSMKKELPPNVIYHDAFFDRAICPLLYSYGVKKWWWGKYAYPILYLLLSFYLKIKKLFCHKEKFDIAIAFSGHINDLTFLTERFVLADKRVVWCHGALLPYLAVCDGYVDLYKKVDYIVTLSDMLEYSVYAGHEFFHHKQIKRIYNPSFIRQQIIDYEKVRLLKQQYGDFVLMIARATPQKDHKTAMNAIQELKMMGLEKNLVFVGDGELKESLEEYSRKIGIDNHCFFVGNKTDVCNYIEASYINLLASIYEGLPTVMVEAMGLSKPCVMTNSDGGELSSYGRYCYLLPIGDYKGIAKALYDLYTNDNIYRKYTELSTVRFESFKPEVVYKELCDFLFK